MLRKVIISLVIGTSILGAAYASNQSESNLSCFYLKSTEVLPQGNLSEYPSYASLGSHFDTGGERAFVFDPRNKRWAAYDKDGYLVASGIANGGGDFCPELGRMCHTPTGVHRVVSTGTSDCVSKTFPLGVGGAAMPFCMFFGGEGNAIHGSPYISNRNGSHGCIRVRTSAAHWLHDHFIQVGTKVVVLPY